MSKRSKSCKGKKNLLFRGRRMQPCTYCGRPLYRETATVDHVRPLSAGGMHKLNNCVLACQSCNNRKGSMSREQFLHLIYCDRMGAPA